MSTLPCGHLRMADGPCPICRHLEIVTPQAKPPATPTARRYTLEERLACTLRGEATGKQAACQSCDPTKTTPTYACSAHGECVLTLRVKDKNSTLVTCLHCKDRLPPPHMPADFKPWPLPRAAAPVPPKPAAPKVLTLLKSLAALGPAERQAFAAAARADGLLPAVTPGSISPS